jgi:hypothetical protein
MYCLSSADRFGQGECKASLLFAGLLGSPLEWGRKPGSSADDHPEDGRAQTGAARDPILWIVGARSLLATGSGG